MKALKRPNRHNSLKMISTSPQRIVRLSQMEAAPQTSVAGASTPEQSGQAHPLADVLGQFEGEAWEEHRAMLQKLRQADAEEDLAE